MDDDALDVTMTAVCERKLVGGAVVGRQTLVRIIVRRGVVSSRVADRSRESSDGSSEFERSKKVLSHSVLLTAGADPP